VSQSETGSLSGGDHRWCTRSTEEEKVCDSSNNNIIIIMIIIIRDNNYGTCMSVDVAIAGDRNVVKKEAGRILKYK
jgi:hypothetical protein